MANQEETKVLQEEVKKLENFIKGISLECENMSDGILDRLCKRVIKNLNQLDPTMASSTDDYPRDFKFFDRLCVELETKSYEDISPFMQETIEEYLMSEYKDLPKMEKFVLDHSECWDLMDSDDSNIREKIFSAFADARSKHLKLKKIENFMLKF